MASNVSRKHVFGGLAVVAALAALNGVAGGGSGALTYDHTKAWSYVKRAHTPAFSLERRLGDAASLVAGRPVQVRCEDVAIGTRVEPGGVVEFHGGEPADFARVRPDVCTDLTRFIRSPEGAAECLARNFCSIAIVRSARAVDVLAHESIHLRGVRAEAVAECYAMQADPRVARDLGAGPADAAALAVIQYVHTYPRMPAAYRSADCRPGGRLDLEPGGGWPD